MQALYTGITVKLFEAGIAGDLLQRLPRMRRNQLDPPTWE